MNAIPKPILSDKSVTVQHREGTAPTVDNDPIYLRSDLGDQMNWACDHPGKTFRITFLNDRSPFARTTFDNQHPDSGPIQPGATGEYKYSVEIDGHINDPKIIIQP
jgi:hypothetical protein